MDKELDEDLKRFFISIGYKEEQIPVTYKEKLEGLRDAASRFESDLTVLDKNISKLVVDDAIRVGMVNELLDKDIKLFNANGLIIRVIPERRIERKENFKNKIKSVFKK